MVVAVMKVVAVVKVVVVGCEGSGGDSYSGYESLSYLFNFKPAILKFLKHGNFI